MYVSDEEEKLEVIVRQNTKEVAILGQDDIESISDTEASGGKRPRLDMAL